MNPIIRKVNETINPKPNNIPDFAPGDNVTVSYKIIEGNKERIQDFRGDVIQVRGAGDSRMFTVRKISNGVGVERIFPLNSPFIAEVTLNKTGKVRRAKLYYLRGLSGKASRIKEKRAAVSAN
jgi:large subunit ribosomal protein L19